MSFRHTLKDRVQFADTDMAGIVHFSNFFRYMERVEHDFFRSLGMSIWDGNNLEVAAEARVGWPRVHASADFRLPLHFEEEIEIELLMEELRNKTIHYCFQFWKHPDSPDERALAATGRFTVVCVSFDAQTRRMKAVAIPDEWREKLEVAPEGSIPS